VRETIGEDVRHLVAYYGVCELASVRPTTLVELQTGTSHQFSFGGKFIGPRGQRPVAVGRSDDSLTVLTFLDNSGRQVTFIGAAPYFHGYLNMPATYFHGRVESGHVHINALPSNRAYQYRF
jgi:hypothetical protein